MSEHIILNLVNSEHVILNLVKSEHVILNLVKSEHVILNLITKEHVILNLITSEHVILNLITSAHVILNLVKSEHVLHSLESIYFPNTFLASFCKNFHSLWHGFDQVWTYFWKIFIMLPAAVFMKLCTCATLRNALRYVKLCRSNVSMIICIQKEENNWILNFVDTLNLYQQVEFSILLIRWIYIYSWILRR